MIVVGKMCGTSIDKTLFYVQDLYTADVLQWCPRRCSCRTQMMCLPSPVYLSPIMMPKQSGDYAVFPRAVSVEIMMKVQWNSESDESMLNTKSGIMVDRPI